MSQAVRQAQARESRKTTLPPAVLTIFGITGDLAGRKLLPSLYQLARADLLPKTFRVVGITRRSTTSTQLMAALKNSLIKSNEPIDEQALKQLGSAISIVEMDLAAPADYAKLKLALNDVEDELQVCLFRLFYLAIPPTLFGAVATKLGEHDLNSGCQHGSTDGRLLIEKPFGSDLTSAQDLITTLNKSFSEQQIYRIDHYLAKETSQNIVTFRSCNPMFEALLSAQHVSHIMITAAETLGVEARGASYEQMGALRDVVQSHMLQLLALLTMKLPDSLDAKEMHRARAKLLAAVQPPHDDQMDIQTVRAQYQGYGDEAGNARSTTETYAALKLGINNDTWRGVPVYLRTGKALSQKVTEITVAFKDQASAKRNHLTIRIQPQEGIVLDVTIKKPGFARQTQHVQMDFCYPGSEAAHPDAYERVLVDALQGDQTLFASSAEVLASWQVVEPILHAWRHNRSPLQPYQKDTWGPEAANKLIAGNGEWLTDTLNICKLTI